MISPSSYNLVEPNDQFLYLQFDNNALINFKQLYHYFFRFGNMWAQTWENAFKIVSPFSNVTNPLDEVNEALVAQVYTFLDIFRHLLTFKKYI
jgi:hypothetical protein